MGHDNYLSSFIENVYLETFLRRRIPNTKINFKEYEGEGEGSNSILVKNKSSKKIP
jgi:hypothetical protein